MDALARLNSNGRVTVPLAVREALGLRVGDDVRFRIDGDEVLLARTVEALDEWTA